MSLDETRLNESLIKERRRFKDNWSRVEKILKLNRGRFGNKNDVVEEALNLLEAKLNGKLKI